MDTPKIKSKSKSKSLHGNKRRELYLRSLKVGAGVACIMSASAAYTAEVSSVLSALSPIKSSKTAMLEVIDSYAELHTGPGKGYPVFYVVENTEWIEVLTRRPDWYEVRTEKGKVGWVSLRPSIPDVCSGFGMALASEQRAANSGRCFSKACSIELVRAFMKCHKLVPHRCAFSHVGQARS